MIEYLRPHMNIKTLKLLRIGTSVLGWLLVIGILANLLGQLDIYLRSQKIPMGFPGIPARFDIVSAFNAFFSSLGIAFFAFLIAAIISMVEKRAPVGIEMATRLMTVCCLSYLAEALARFWSFVLNLCEVLPIFANSGWRFWFPYASTLISVLVPILYAGSIFVLYTHFTRMVTFESEVA